ncbi:hypothetical protein [Leeuwenhoekiella sp. MAR_2009_132]|uniref:hypothetical protein n=1 Tax=Leeuwenhoekiella sp. MAR_2009_132 TaxID=1392489 RepID=UPI00048ED3FE|nr:hypothetical protein [Leeuwenhoekiella sp. MAR_2009_132]
MKKIKILYWILLAITILISISIVTDFFYSINMKSTFEVANQNTILGYYTQFIYPVLFTVLILGLVYILFALKAIIVFGGFNSRSTMNFKYAGTAIGLYGFGYLLFQLNFIYSIDASKIFTNSVSSIFITIIGYGIYSFSEILKTGELLKQENDLTV